MSAAFCKRSNVTGHGELPVGADAGAQARVSLLSWTSGLPLANDALRLCIQNAAALASRAV
jgi:hypothetical protein